MAASGTAVRLAHLEQRMERIEETNPAVIVEQVAQLTRRVDMFVRIGIGLLLALVGSSISFAFTILSRLGHG